MKPARSKSRNSQAYLAAQAAQIESDLAAIRRAMRQPLEAEYVKGNVTVPQKAVMQVVVQIPGVTLKELSQAISLAHSTVSGIVDRLEKRGMIDRRRDSTDGRLTRLYPSAAVAQFVRERIPALRTGPLNEALARASADDRLRIVSALKCLRELLESD
jgi:MarR family transcriptional regulator, organic hydroperoxide resistance regulator